MTTVAKCLQILLRNILLQLVKKISKCGAAALSLVLALNIAATQVSAAPASAKFGSCTALLAKHKSGVASSAKKRGSSTAKVSASIYSKNKKFDSNKDGIACGPGDKGVTVAWSAVEFSGVGSFVQDIPVPDGEAAILTFSHAGESNFIVSSLNKKFETVDLIVNEIGNFEGTALLTRGYSFGIEDPKQLEITADGAWKVRIAPAASAPVFTGAASGKGPAVLRYDGQATRIAATHDGESNFIITTYQSNATMGDLVVNEIGVYSGVVVLRKNPYIVINADGNWKITKK